MSAVTIGGEAVEHVGVINSLFMLLRANEPIPVGTNLDEPVAPEGIRSDAVFIHNVILSH